MELSQKIYQKHRMTNTRILIAVLSCLFVLAKPSLVSTSLTRELFVMLGYVFIVFCVLGRILCTLFIGGVMPQFI